mmetsp:Transcript_5285/g.33191  ORF Transcript_5285/g.33191 Transcript_5285/m.33191 type:complete len:229 (+) Transcript_5285:2279-2965(+)
MLVEATNFPARAELFPICSSWCSNASPIMEESASCLIDGLGLNCPSIAGIIPSPAFRCNATPMQLLDTFSMSSLSILMAASRTRSYMWIDCVYFPKLSCKMPSLKYTAMLWRSAVCGSLSLFSTAGMRSSFSCTSLLAESASILVSGWVTLAGMAKFSERSDGTGSHCAKPVDIHFPAGAQSTPQNWALFLWYVAKELLLLCPSCGRCCTMLSLLDPKLPSVDPRGTS